MTHHGNFIKFYRNKINMTQKELSIGICSAIHIYRLEKGHREPSVQVLDMISGKLGFSLHLYSFTVVLLILKKLWT